MDKKCFSLYAVLASTPKVPAVNGSTIDGIETLIINRVIPESCRSGEGKNDEFQNY